MDNSNGGKLIIEDSVDNNLANSNQPNTVVGKSISPNESVDKEESKNDTKYYISGLIFFSILIAALFLFSALYTAAHGINYFGILTQPDNPIPYDCIGGERNPFTIGFEILFWSLVGVICFVAYRTGRTILKGNYNFWESIIYWLSTSLFAVGIAHAVIFALSVISLI